MNLLPFKTLNVRFQKSVRLFQRTFFLFITLFFINYTQANNDFHKAWLFTFNFEFHKADSIQKSFKPHSFNFYSIPFLKFKQKFFQLITNASNAQISEHHLELKQLLNRQKTYKNHLPEEWFNYFISEMHLYHSFLYGKTNDNWQAFKHFSTAKNSASKSLQANSAFQPALKLMGVIELLESAIPVQYNSLAKFFGFKGNVQSGLAKLFAAYTLSEPSEKVHRSEVAFYLMYAATNTSIKISIDSYLKQFDNLLESPALTLAFLTYVKGKPNWSKEKEQVMESLHETMISKLPYLALLKSDYWLGKHEVEKANASLAQFTKLNKADGFDCRIIQRYYWISILKGNSTERYFVTQVKNAIKRSEDDYQAEIELSKNFNYNRSLLLARIFFDEGRISEALTALKQADSTSTDWNKKEYHYRKGRIQYQSNQLTEALKSFKKVDVLASINDTDYFGAYASFYSAEIYLKLRNLSEMQNQIKKAESYQSHAYVKSLGARLSYLSKEAKNDNPSKK